jgi:endo-1,4-beta-xylanase
MHTKRTLSSFDSIRALLLLSLAFGIGSGGVFAQETLRSLAAKRGVYIGTAVGSPFYASGSDPKYIGTLKAEFNILVAENEMKFDQIEPNQGQFAWTKADALMDFAAQNQMAVRGHNLVWYQQSGWLGTSGLGRNEMLMAINNHANKIMSRYKGRILEWDVVNEAIDDGGLILRDTFHKNSIGDDYIDSAFWFARRADPQALLFYNDYGGEGLGGKADKIFDLVKGLKQRGIPIDGVGFQAHFENKNWPKVSDIDKNIKRLAALGLMVSFTEVDFRIPLPADSSQLELQKTNYRSLLGVCLANSNCKSFVTWGFTDAFSWVPGFFTGFGASLPYDAQYQKKPAYAGLQEALIETSLYAKPKRITSRMEWDSPWRKLSIFDATGRKFQTQARKSK